MADYYFVNKKRIEDLELEVERLHRSQKECCAQKEASRKPLGLAAITLLLTVVLVLLTRNSALFAYVFIVGVVLVQMCIDTYKGPERPYWSAAFRALALLGWASQQVMQWLH